MYFGINTIKGVIMSANGISNLQYKADRQIAKLNIAQAKRQGRIVAADGTISGPVDPTKPYYRDNNLYDITLLPTRYAAGDNTTVIDNIEPPLGLTQGRPWENVYLGYLTTESQEFLITEDNNYITF